MTVKHEKRLRAEKPLNTVLNFHPAFVVPVQRGMLDNRMKFSSKNVLIGMFMIFLAASLYRAYHFWMTGLFVPDEFGYAYFHLGDLQYQTRDFFNLVNLVLFTAFQVRNVDDIVRFMPVYFMLWFSVGIVATYKTMKLLVQDDRTIAKTLLLSLTIPVFLLFGVGILTESVAFAMTMLGIYLTVRYWKTHRIWLVPATSLCFVAASYSRIDFMVFQLLGFIPFLLYEYRSMLATHPLRTSHHFQSHSEAIAAFLKNRRAWTVFLLFVIPAVFFFYWPANGIQGAYQNAQVFVQIIQPETPGGTHYTNPGDGSDSSGTPGGEEYVIPGVRIPTTGNPLPTRLINTFRMLVIGPVIGFNPVVYIVILASFIGMFSAILRKRIPMRIDFILGLLSLSVIAVATIVYFSEIIPLNSSTYIRYSYDALPAFFLLTPYLLKKKVSKMKVYGFILLPLTLFAGVATSSFQPAIQSNLTHYYPFMTGDSNFLSLDYRTPYAQLRDYFHTVKGPITVIGEARTLGPIANLTLDPSFLIRDWRFTPGVSDLNITFYPYVNQSTLQSLGLHKFYFYVEKGGWNYFNGTTIYLTHLPRQTIFDTQSFYLAEVIAPQ